MAITASNLTANYSDTDTTSYNTASVSVTAGDLILVAVTNSKGSTPDTPSISGVGTTFALVHATNGIVTYDASGTQRKLTLFYGIVPSTTSGAITIGFGANTQTGCAWAVDKVTGHDSTGTIVQSAKNNTDAMTPITVTLAAFASTDNATYGAFAVSGNNDATIGTGFTQLGDATATTPAQVIFTEWKSTNDTSVDCNIGGTPPEAGGIAIEIKAAVASTSVKDLIGSGIVVFPR